MSHISKALDYLESIYNAGAALPGEYDLIRKAREELAAFNELDAMVNMTLAFGATEQNLIALAELDDRLEKAQE